MPTPKKDTTNDKTVKKANSKVEEKDQAKAAEVIREVIVSQPAVAVSELNLDRGKVELLKRTIAKGATDDELLMFINVCKGLGLSPFLRHVHLVKRWDSRLGIEVAAVQVGIDGFRSVAESTEAYAGNDDPIFKGEKVLSQGPGKEPIKVPNEAFVVVRKIVQGNIYDFTATARWDEYYPGDKIGFMWRSKPYVMLGKCAEALALRKAFPKVLGGVYVPEELEKNIQTPQENKTDKIAKAIEMIAKSKDVPGLQKYLGTLDKSAMLKEDKDELVAAVNARIKELMGVQDDKLKLIK